MKKILIMFAMLLVCSVASAQKDTTATSTSAKTQKEKAAVKNKHTNADAPGTKAKQKDAQTKQKTAQPKRERVNGTTGVQEFPDTEGAGTGTGNDTHIGTPPGQPETGTKK